MTIEGGSSPEKTIRRKVTSSGVIWLEGRSYYISRRLAGRTISVRIGGGKLIVDVTVPLHKEYSLPRTPPAAELARPRRLLVASRTV